MNGKFIFCSAAAAALLLNFSAFGQEPAGGGYRMPPENEDTGRIVAAPGKDTPGGQDTKAMGTDKKSTEGVTADQQSHDKNDREITKNIRKAIMDDESLSMYADNIKIITRGGMVTLKGKVKTQDEKNKIMEKAAGIAGKDKVTDNMEIKEQKK